MPKKLETEPHVCNGQTTRLCGKRREAKMIIL